jgi:hypothetical protein
LLALRPDFYGYCPQSHLSPFDLLPLQLSQCRADSCRASEFCRPTRTSRLVARQAIIRPSSFCAQLNGDDRILLCYRTSIPVARFTKQKWCRQLIGSDWTPNHSQSLAMSVVRQTVSMRTIRRRRDTPRFLRMRQSANLLMPFFQSLGPESKSCERIAIATSVALSSRKRARPYERADEESEAVSLSRNIGFHPARRSILRVATSASRDRLLGNQPLLQECVLDGASREFFLC